MTKDTDETARAIADATLVNNYVRLAVQQGHGFTKPLNVPSFDLQKLAAFWLMRKEIDSKLDGFIFSLRHDIPKVERHQIVADMLELLDKIKELG